MAEDSNERGKAGGLWGTRRAPQAAAPALHRPAEGGANRRVLPIKFVDGNSEEYKAFELQERARRLNIRCAHGPSRFPSYHYLLDIIFDHNFSSAFTLVYTFMVVEVTGQNLEAVANAIASGSCDRVTEFHPLRHGRPAGGDPIIEHVEIIAAGAEPEIGEK